MKILHIAQDLDVALVDSRVVHGIAQDVTLTQGRPEASALDWLQANPDTGAVIVEVQGKSCATFVAQLRGLDLTTPVVVVAESGRLEALFAALHAGADGCVVAGPAFETDLRRTLAEAIERERKRRQPVRETPPEPVSRFEPAPGPEPHADAEAAHSASVARETRICLALQQRLFELETALRKAQERRASDAVSFADQLAKRHAEFTASLAQAAQRSQTLAAESSVAAAALDEARQARRTDAAAAAEQLRQREAELHVDLSVAAAEKASLKEALAAADAAHEDTRHRAASDLAAANERQAALEDLLNQETDRRENLDRKLAAVEEAHQEQNRRHQAELTRGAAELNSLQARSAAALDAGSKREAELLDQVQHLHRTVEEERGAHERARLASESEVQRISTEYGQIRQSFDRLQSAFQGLEQIAAEHAAERARLEALVALRDSQLSAQAERHRMAEQAGQDALAARDERLRQSLAAGAAESARLQAEIAALRGELEATRTHAAALRGVAERVPQLQTQLERSERERRRQFERAPYALCRCSPSGAIVDANHSFVALLGCRRLDELRNQDFVAAALDNAGDLGWLLERARTTRKTETVETNWTTAEGRRLVVRLQALVSPGGAIDIVAEDITGVLALEERLRQAERHEAVGRLASEVAVTCESQLSDVSRGAHELLARAGSDDILRRHAEQLLTEVSRAASLVRQFGTYAGEQMRSREPVSAQRVVRDLAPVLKRLLGEQIEVVLPKSAGGFNVDVDAARLERVLVNVAGYARERMPWGGQVRIELATTAIGRRFAASSPNVNPGEYVLLTVTEVPAIGQPGGDSPREPQASDKPGIDLGVLADLIASCGGHLWLEAQPAGTMVVKMHLPKPSAAHSTENRGGRLSKWFRPRPTANTPA